MENRIYYRQNMNRCQSSQQLKFKQIPIKKQFNELHSKYEIFNTGTPNVYSEDLEMLRAKNIKQQISMIDLPNLQDFITQINQSEKDKLLNQRNYDLYPTLVKQPSMKFKDILSEKQQIKDFILWFQQQYQNIQKSKNTQSKKFKDKQTLIAAGFTQMTGCIAKLSKNRSQILKMLWNRQNFQLKNIIEGLSGNNIKTQKELLQQISTLHNDYQKLVDELSKNNNELDQQLKKETIFSHNCVVNLRILRKRIKKLQYAGKKLAQSNTSLKKENLHLMQENIKLLSNIKSISQEEAVVLNYRKLQIHTQKQHLKYNAHKNLVEITRQNSQETRTPFIDFQRKKNTLKEYFQQRIKENPDEKILIKEDYLMDDEQCPRSIEQYFKSVINRPTIQMQLLSETQSQPFTKEKAINTQSIPGTTKQQILVLNLDKAIQVQLFNPTTDENQDKTESILREKRMYQIIDQKQEDEKQKQSKLRLIKHRMSRRNSLTLLQIQNLNEIRHNIMQRKHGLSHFRRQRNTIESKIQDSNLSVGNSQNLVQGQQIDASEQLFILNPPIKAGLDVITLPTSIQNTRKSQFFQNILKQLKNIQSKSQQQSIQMNLLNTKGEVQQQLKQNQLQDLIQKHLHSNSIVSKNPEKSLNKILLSVFKNVWQKDKIKFLFQLLEVIKNSYGNIKSVIWKFLNTISLIHSNQNNNSLLKIISILLKINKNYDIYSLINTQEVADIYFGLFRIMTIKNINDTAFSLWKCCTTCEKIRGLEFASVLQRFFSEKKRKYIDNKLNEFIAVSRLQSQSKKTSKNNSNKRIQIVSQDNVIIKLNPLILYIIQVYLIEKHLYYISYCDFLQFLASEDNLLSIYVFIWLLQLFGYTEDKQIEIINFACSMKQKQKALRETQNMKYQKYLKAQMFYCCCVKFDFPLFQEVFVSIHEIFKKLPQKVQKKYYKMIKLQEWSYVKEDLLRKYKKNSESPTYFNAFTQVSDKLERQLKKGSSIYGEYAPLQQVKRSEQVFSFFYKSLIIFAHPSLQAQKQIQKSDIV